MKNNSCTLVLSGHGCYSKNGNIIDMRETDYKIIFVSSMKMVTTNASHNYLLYSLVHNEPFTWQMLESVKTTRFADKEAPSNLIVDMDAVHTNLIYDHAVANAENVIDVNYLVDLAPERFSEYDIRFNNEKRKWSGKLLIEVDKKQIEKDVQEAHQEENFNEEQEIALSANNILLLKLSAGFVGAFAIKLSDLISEIIPKIKIPVSYHQNGSVDVICPYIDDGVENMKNYFSTEYSEIYNQDEDKFCQLKFPEDLTMIFGMCRDEV